MDGVIISSMSCLVEWKSAQNRGAEASFSVFQASDGAKFWVKPQEIRIKIIVDATIFRDRAAFGLA